MAAKRRKRGGINAKSRIPFPIPIANISKSVAHASNCYYYTGHLENGSVTIRHSGDMAYLYEMGFFGKGNLSRGEPMFADMGKFSYNQTTKHKLPNVMSKRRYLRHLQWAKVNSCHHSAYEDPEELAQKQLNLSNAKVDDRKAEFGVILTEDNNQLPPSKKAKKHSLDGQSSEIPEFVDSADFRSDSDCSINNDTSRVDDNSDTETSRVISTDICDWSTKEGDENFWFSEPSTSEKNVNKDDVDTIFKLSDFEYSADERCVEPDKDKNDSAKMLYRIVQGNLSHKQEADLGLKERSAESTDDKNCTNSSLTAPENCSSPNSLDDSQNKLFCDQNVTEIDTKNEQFCDQNFPENKQICDETIPEVVAMHPLSLCDEKDGNFLVVGDSDGEEDGSEPWRVCLRRLSPVRETLQLSLEEAFFLSYGLGCLSITNESQKCLTLEETWLQFSQMRANFIPNYVVYHNLRSKGWVPRCGLKYGAEFVLYEKGPPFNHSSFSVMVRPVIQSSLKHDPLFPERFSTWASLLGVDRVSEHVAKEILLCYVIRPPTVTADDLKSPDCIKSFTIQEIIMKRWNPNQERSSKTDEK